jgi:RHS repeat-associated protein
MDKSKYLQSIGAGTSIRWLFLLLRRTDQYRLLPSSARSLAALALLLVTMAFGPRAEAQIYDWHAGWGPTFDTGDDLCIADLARINTSEYYSYTFLSASPPGAPTSAPPTGSTQWVTCYYWVTSTYDGNYENTGTDYGYSQNVSEPEYFATSTPIPLTQTCSCNAVGHPINPAVGNVYTTEEDIRFSGPSPIAFKRYYNSADTVGADGVIGWRHSYDRFITTVYQTVAPTYPGSSSTVSPEYSTPSAACTSGFAAIQSSVSAWAGATAAYNDGVCVIANGSTTIATLPIQVFPQVPPPSTAVEYDLTRDDGQVLRYSLQNGVINNQPGVSVRLAVTGTGFTVTDDDDNVETYNSAGVLQSITGRNGVVQTISYDGSGRFSGVTDSFGNALTVTRNSQESIASVSVTGGGTVSYAYDSAGRLSTVTNLDSTTLTYTYGNDELPYALTAEYDENNNQYSTWAYNSAGQATSTQEAGGANAQTLAYNSNGSVTITDALSAVRTFSYSRVGDINKVVSISGSQCPTCQESAATTYDAYGWVSSRTDYNGNITCYANDPVRGLELVRVEGFASGSTCPSNLSTYTSASGTLQRKITTVWDSTWREPDSITEPNRATSFTYDSYGNMLTKTITDTSVTPNVSRTWTYTYYNSGLYGQVQTLTGPRTDITTDVTTYTYYNCTTGGECGQIDTITNGLSQTTTVTSYNVYSEPLTITDANGIVTTLAYDARERLTSRHISTETTGYSYYPTGLLKTVTLPDSSSVTYSYDNAHRLNKITDGPGNYITYTLDAMSNVTGASTYDPSNTLHRKHTRAYNTLSELYQDINSAGTSAVTTTYGYDSNGNQTSIAAPLSRNTANQFDALNRLNQITDPNSGITQLAYDSNDNLASVQDPRNLTTSYSHDGFGELTQLASPDTGTTTKTYDSAGNLKTATDARSALATYSYDALNRLIQMAYSDNTINLTYDSGTNGVGRLTGASDSYHSMAWTYDALGRVNGRGQTVAGVTESVGYSFANGDLVTLVTPSGQTVTYGYTNHQITSIAVNGTTVLSGAIYDPFGPVTGWTWGNSTTVSRSYTEDGVPNQIVTASVTNGYTEDNALRITGISDSGLSSNTWTFGYDLLDRVTSGSSSALTRGYTFDANGNVQSETGTVAFTAAVASSSNEISSVTGGVSRTYSYDAAGNITGDGTNSYSFNQRGRMISANSTSYIYNTLGQLIEKSGEGSTTILMYDEAGHILGEYTSTGALIEETIWMGDLPVATLQPNGSSISIYYIHSDHLGTPRKITQPSSNTLAWRWDPDTFGSLAPNQNPGGLGTFIYNLRFPGQYYLPETGLYYNYYRDYDPQTGRFLESDPIGLEGGTPTTYGYAGSNPLSNIDPWGLFLYPWHVAFTNQALAGDVSFPGLAAQVGGVDFLDGSQLPANAFWHAMSDGTTNQTPAQAQALYNNYIDAEINSCTQAGLARALHAAQDSAARGHTGFQPWNGGSTPLHIPSASHIEGDANPNSAEKAQAVQNSIAILARYRKTCGCKK